MKAVRTVFAYLNRSKHYCISAQTYAADVYILATLAKCSLEPEERSFMIDSNHAGNAEVQNRRSQNGWVTKFTHAAEWSQNGTRMQRSPKWKRNTTAGTRRARGPLFLYGLNLMAHVSRWVIGSCWVIGSLNLTWVNWVNWVIKQYWVKLGH